MNKSLIIYFLSIWLFLGYLNAQSELYVPNNSSDSDRMIRVCGTAPPTIDEILFSKLETDQWLQEYDSRDDSLLFVYVAWHVIHASNNAGNLTDAQIAYQIQVMNYDFQIHNITFILDTIDRTANDTWFEGWDPENGGMDAQGMQALNYDPYHYLNI